jgi:hypothetical protein
MSKTQETPEKEVTRDEVVAWYKDQIELATLRADLAEQQSRAAKSDAERIQATMFIAQAQAAGKAPNEEDEEEEAPTSPTLKRKK